MVLPAKRSNFTESLGRNLTTIAPVAIVAQPGSERQFEVGSMWSDDPGWRSLVTEFAERAAFTIFAASELTPDSGLSFEIELIGSGLTTGRVVVVFPPGFDLTQARASNGFLTQAAKLPIFKGIEEANPSPYTLLMARQRDGKWFCYDSSSKTDIEYGTCMLSFLLDDADEYEASALGPTELPSTLRAQRFAATVAGSVGVTSEIVVNAVGLLYPPLRKVLVAFERRNRQ